jgi:hypothetical protein
LMPVITAWERTGWNRLRVAWPTDSRCAMKTGRWLLVLTMLILASCSSSRGRWKSNLHPAARSILDGADHFDLYSLEPWTDAGTEGERLHGRLVLGKTTISDPTKRSELLARLDAGIADQGKGAKCFDPRHAIRATYAGKTVDLVICFECGWVYVYLDGKEVKQEEVNSGIQPTFDEALTAAGVPLAKKRKSR